MHAEYANVMKVQYASSSADGKMHPGIIMDFILGSIDTLHE